MLAESALLIFLQSVVETLLAWLGSEPVNFDLDAQTWHA